MLKIKTFFSRLQSASLKRMFMYINEIHGECGKSKLITFLDMAWCIARYGIGYLEYRVFGFCYISGKKKRLTFMTMKDNLELVHRLNKREYYHFFDDKLDFNERFKKYLGRDFIDLRKTDASGLASFTNGKEYIFAKATDSFGGQGIERISVRNISDFSELYDRLNKNGQFDIEDAIVQHEEMNALFPGSINTVRMVTLLVGGVPHHMYSLVRVGNGDKCVDNISSGGMYAPVDENGVIFRNAFCDKTGKYYEEHPVTKTKFIGFQIPCFEQAKQLIKEAALVVPEMGYVGWDVGMSENGPVFVEGNNLPGYDMCQNYFHLPDDKTGILPKFKKVLGDSF